MKTDDFKEITAEELEKVSGGFTFSADTDGSGIAAQSGTVTCIYCGSEIVLRRKGKTVGQQFKCECGATYNPSLASPWIPPRK